MTVDRASIDAMANIMNLLNGAGGADLPVETTAHMDIPMTPDMPEYLYEDAAPVATRVPMSSPDIDAMKKILEAFHGVENSTLNAAEKDSTLKEALQTERTPKGARIGSWEIVVKENKGVKRYDVVSTDGKTVIASDLYLYEAAYGLVKELNKGSAINGKPVRDLLKLEEDFARNRDNAAHYKQRAKTLREKDEFKAAVAEDRFDEAQRQALSAHDEILRLAGLRR